MLVATAVSVHEYRLRSLCCNGYQENILMPARYSLTQRAINWAVGQIRFHHAIIQSPATQLHCDWHAINMACCRNLLVTIQIWIVSQILKKRS
jgi:hypothetical protein